MSTNGSDRDAVRRWPRAWRLMFILAAATLCWALVLGLLWLAFRRR